MRASSRLLRSVLQPLPSQSTSLCSSSSIARASASSPHPRTSRSLSSSPRRPVDFQIKVVVGHPHHQESSDPLSTLSTPFGTDHEIADETMPKAAWYAVHTGRQPGVYTTWAEADAQVKGFNAAKHRKFSSEKEALAFVGAGASSKSKAGPVQPRSTSASSAGSRPKPAPTANPKRPFEANRASKTSSPPIDASPAQLSPRLQNLVADGWTFTPQGKVVAYCDGSGLSNGKMGARAGVGLWWSSTGEAAGLNLSERVPGALQTNNRGELLAVIRAIEVCPLNDIPLEIRTDSEYTIMCMTTYLPIWLKKGLLTRPGAAAESKIKNLDLIKHLFVLLRERRAGVKFKHVRGHAGLEGNEQADRLARRGAEMPALPDRVDWLDPSAVADDPQDSPQVEVEVDEDCLMTEEEMQALEEELAQ